MLLRSLLLPVALIALAARPCAALPLPGDSVEGVIVKKEAPFAPLSSLAKQKLHGDDPKAPSKLLAQVSPRVEAVAAEQSPQKEIGGATAQDDPSEYTADVVAAGKAPKKQHEGVGEAPSGPVLPKKAVEASMKSAKEWSAHAHGEPSAAANDALKKPHAYGKDAAVSALAAAVASGPAPALSDHADTFGGKAAAGSDAAAIEDAQDGAAADAEGVEDAAFAGAAGEEDVSKGASEEDVSKGAGEEDASKGAGEEDVSKGAAEGKAVSEEEVANGVAEGGANAKVARDDASPDTATDNTKVGLTVALAKPVVAAASDDKHGAKAAAALGSHVDPAKTAQKSAADKAGILAAVHHIADEASDSHKHGTDAGAPADGKEGVSGPASDGLAGVGGDQQQDNRFEKSVEAEAKKDMVGAASGPAAAEENAIATATVTSAEPSITVPVAKSVATVPAAAVIPAGFEPVAETAATPAVAALDGLSPASHHALVHTKSTAYKHEHSAAAKAEDAGVADDAHEEEMARTAEHESSLVAKHPADEEAGKDSEEENEKSTADAKANALAEPEAAALAADQQVAEDLGLHALTQFQAAGEPGSDAADGTAGSDAADVARAGKNAAAGDIGDAGDVEGAPRDGSDVARAGQQVHEDPSMDGEEKSDDDKELEQEEGEEGGVQAAAGARDSLHPVQLQGAGAGGHDVAGSFEALSQHRKNDKEEDVGHSHAGHDALADAVDPEAALAEVAAAQAAAQAASANQAGAEPVQHESEAVWAQRSLAAAEHDDSKHDESKHGHESVHGAVGEDTQSDDKQPDGEHEAGTQVPNPVDRAQAILSLRERLRMASAQPEVEAREIVGGGGAETAVLTEAAVSEESSTGMGLEIWHLGVGLLLAAVAGVVFRRKLRLKGESSRFSRRAARQ